MPGNSQRVGNLSSLKLAYLASQLRPDTEVLLSEPVAVIGMGVRFPGGAVGPDAYWQLLYEGSDAISAVPADRWDKDAVRDPGRSGQNSRQWGAFLDNVFDFDAEFFGITPREAISMDPQQRLLLEVSWEALEDAGIAASTLAGSQTGVFVGISYTDYGKPIPLKPQPVRLDAYISTGTLLSIAAGRVSYFLGLHGPSMAIDTACSSSLTSVHLACQSLRGGECHLALAGGVNVLSEAGMLAFSELRALASDGRCKTFDAAADGYSRGEGCGIVVLKRLSDALAGSDNILAVIRGSAVNQDGRSAGLTAPNGPAQEAVIRKALAGLDPGHVSYVEAHGTGTPLGDPIEIRALASVMGRAKSRQRPLVIGSVKTNIGHLESAAGIASLTKVVLALNNEIIPPHLHLKKLNPFISLDEIPAVLPTKPLPWPASEVPRVAGVSSFGFSGTNAHVIVEEPPRITAEPSASSGRPLHVLALSGKTEEALRQLAGRYAAYLSAHSEERLADICYSANTGRSHFRHRIAFTAATVSEMRVQLEDFLAGRSPTWQGAPGSIPKVGFFFPADCTVDSRRLLYGTQPVFREAFDRCLGLMQSQSDAWAEGLAGQFALSELWRSWGVEPAVVLGSGNGHYLAACAAGVFTLESAIHRIDTPSLHVDASAPQIRILSPVTPNGAGLATALQKLRDTSDIAIEISPAEQDWERLLTTLAALYVRGVEINWAGFDRSYQRRKLRLPNYPFQRKRFCIYDAIAPASVPNDCLYELQWLPAPLLSSSHEPLDNRRSSWLVLADRTGVGARLAALLEERGAKCQLVYADAMDACDLAPVCRRFQGVVYLWALDLRTPEDAWQPSAFAGLLNVLQALAPQEGPGSPRVWLVSRGAHRVGSALHPIALEQAPLWGLGRVAAHEHPALWGGIVDLDPETSHEDARFLCDELYRADNEDQVAYRRGKRYGARLARSAVVPRQGPPNIRGDATYIITGGLGGLGLAVAQWLVAKGARHLVLAGRRPASSAIQLSVVQEMERAGAQVLVARADVSQEHDISSLLPEVNSNMPRLAGIFHAAGVLDDGFLSKQSPERIASVMAPKAEGAWLLHKSTQHLALEWFVLFSSASSVLGTPAQAGYAAANAFMDSLAHQRRIMGLPGLSINWGPWADVGMTAELESRGGGRALGGGAVKLLKPAIALEYLEKLLNSDIAQAMVLDADWPALVAQLPRDSSPSLLSGLVKSTTAADPKVANWKQLPPAERATFLKNYLLRTLARTLRMDEVPADRNLLELGVDSLMAMEFINNARRDLDFTLYPREFYEHPSIAALTEYLAGEPERIVRTAGHVTSDPQEILLSGSATRTAGKRNRTMVFLLSSPRSGSTLLRAMLAGHPNLFCPPELHLLGFSGMRNRQDKLGQTHLGEGLQRAFMELKGESAVDSKAWMDEQVERDFPIQEVYRVLQELAGDRMLVDKSPIYARTMQTLQSAEELFEEPKYVHLVRHPYAVIESFVRNRMDRLLGAGELDPYWLAEQIWANSNRNVRSFFRNIDPERCYRVHYEDLVRHPDEIMQALCKFLNIPFTTALLRPYEGSRMLDAIGPQSLSIGDPNFLNHNKIDASLGETWRAVELPQSLSAMTCEVANDLDYELQPDPEPVDASMRESFLTVRNLQLCLCSWGRPSDPLVFCIHGILEHGAAWDPLARRLSGSGLYVVAPDQRGHGRSAHVGPEGSYHLLDFVADIDAILKAMARSAFILVGHSMGALVAGLLAGARPELVNGLVLVEPVLAADGQDSARTLSAYLDHIGSPPGHAIMRDVAAAAERLRSLAPSIGEDAALRAAMRLTEPSHGGVRWRWDHRLLTRAGLAFGLDSRAIRGLTETTTDSVPILAVYGEASPFSQTTGDVLVSAKHVTLPGGHNLHQDAPDALAQSILEFAGAAGRGSMYVRSAAAAEE